MRKAFLSSLLVALLATSSFATTAAPVAPATGNSPATLSAPAQQGTGKININTADAETLQRELVGVGLNKAGAIVAYRESNGAFTSVDELIEVKGIGKAILDRNRDKLAIE